MIKYNRIRCFFVFTCIAAMLSGELYAETRVRIDTLKTVLQVRRPAKEPVKSLDVSPAGPIDTLDTVNEHVKVILYSDNTWRYFKTPDFAQRTDVFDRYWDETRRLKSAIGLIPMSVPKNALKLDTRPVFTRKNISSIGPIWWMRCLMDSI